MPRLLWRERELIAARLASTLTHTLGTPLQVISGRAALALKERETEEMVQHLEIIQRKCTEITTLLWKMLESVRGDPRPELGPLDLRAFVEELVEELARIAPERGVRWDLRVLGESSHFSDLNLCADDLRHAVFTAGLNLLVREPDRGCVVVTLEKVVQEARGVTPVHAALLRIGLRSDALRVGARAPSSWEVCDRHVADPWLHAAGRSVDGGALGWAAIYELTRRNEARIEVNEGEVVLFWPVLP